MTGVLTALALLAVLVLTGLGLLWRHRRRAARTGPFTPGTGSETDASPRDRLVALSQSVRDALTLQFGAAGRAKTTEELAADDRLEQLLGNEGFRELIRFLDQIDRLKFAPERSDNRDGALQEALTTWEPRVATLGAQIRAKPRNRSKASRQA
jgi:hypothetical protein